MGLLDDTTQQQYYQSNNFGNYQFTSLDDIINQFMVVYVGEDKIISKIKRSDVAFHAQRAMQELSFDTFKSCKAQEITVPASLQMILPHDYVNYTKISTVDSAGIKHLLYPTSKTSNPTKLSQDSDGNYQFPAISPMLDNSDFANGFDGSWSKNDVGKITPSGEMLGEDTITITSGELTFTQFVHSTWAENQSRIYSVWQEIDVSQLDTIELSAKGTAAASATNITGGTLKIGLVGDLPDTSTIYYSDSQSLSLNVTPTYLQTLGGNPARLEWSVGQSGITQSLVNAEAIDVSAHSKVYVLITSVVDFATAGTTDSGVNSIDDITLTNVGALSTLETATSSTTWDNYKSATPSENNDDYEDDTYWPMDGSRFGLDPQHAQANGSFYIDCMSGKIHFSSNVSGKTVILDYISDSLGTDGEMQVHKFAEEAMYKWISHAVLASRANTQEYLVNRYKKERFAAIRTAKLRLSNIKLEEITQILRGKSKQIKH